MPATLDRQFETVVADEADGRDHVLRGNRPDHHGRSLRDHPVPEQDRLGEPLISGVEDRTFETGREGVKGLSRDLARVVLETCDLYVSSHLILHFLERPRVELGARQPSK